MQMQVVLEANTWFKSNQSSLFAVVKLLKNPLLNLVRKMVSQSLRVRKGLNLNIAKKRLILRQHFHFLHAMTEQEEIEDEKGTKNVVADHLSKLTIDSTSDFILIDYYFLDESLISLSSMPWFAKNINFLASGFLPAHLDNQDKRKFLSNVQNFYWDNPYLFKYCHNQIFQRCIPDNEVSSVIKLCHFEACRDHFS